MQGRCLGAFLQDGKQLEDIIVYEIVYMLTHTRIDLLRGFALRVLLSRGHKLSVFPRLLVQVAGLFAVVLGQRPLSVREPVIIAVVIMNASVAKYEVKVRIILMRSRNVSVCGGKDKDFF